MRVGALALPLPRYRILGGMALLLFAISLVQILSGGTGRFFSARAGEPFRWTISYTDANGKLVISRVVGPVADTFNEGIVKSSVRVDMDFRECGSFSQYRFWVGPYGIDSTERQPSEWTLLTRGDTGDWVQLGSEQKKDAYQNNSWNTFPLAAHKGCIQHVRWEISKLWKDGNIFRLYRFQLLRPGVF